MADFIVVFDGRATSWRIRREDLAGAAMAERIIPDAGPWIADNARWAVSDGEVGPMEVWLNDSKTALFIEGQLTSAAKMAAVLRLLTPSGVDLVFSDSGYNCPVDVVPGMSAMDIESAAARE